VALVRDAVVGIAAAAAVTESGRARWMPLLASLLPHIIGPSDSRLTIDAMNGIDDSRLDFGPAQPRRTVAWISPCGSVVET
jgi:hypothetical protein